MPTHTQTHTSSRAGSGRKLRSQTLGPRQSHSLNNHFSTSGTSSTANNNLTTSTAARRHTKIQ